MMPVGGIRTVLLMDTSRELARAGERERHMHAQVVTFGLNGITEEQFHEAVAGDAPVFANMPDLLGKAWVRDPETNTYGGLYLWADQDAYERNIRARSSTRSRPTRT